MYILSLETSTKNFSLAISQDDKILRFRNIRTDKILESSMIGTIDKVLDSCHLNLKKIDVLAVGLGPGSFTSLRVGLSMVKAFALGQNKKVIGVGSLDIIASAVSNIEADEICVIVDARRGKVYSAIFDKTLKRKTDYLLTTVDEVLKSVNGVTLFVGNGLELYKEQIQKAYQPYNRKNKSICRPLFIFDKFWYPQAKELAKLTFMRFKNGQYDNPERIVPIYLYPQDCQVDRK